MKPGAIVDVIKSQERTNAVLKRDGLTDRPVRFTACGCPDPNCGGWHTILVDRTLPSEADCVETIQANNKARKSRKRDRA